MILNKSIIRFVLSFSMAVVVTAGLLWLMQALIQMEDLELDEEEIQINLTWVRTVEDLPIEPIIKLPELVEPPLPPPETELPLEVVEGLIGGGIGPIIPIGNKIPKPTPNSYLPDGGPLAVVKVTPQYPQRAAERGIEGYVLVQFTISKTGQVLNPTVIEAAPSNIFNRSALRAVAKFKYQPKVVDGETVAVENVLHRIIYELAKV